MTIDFDALKAPFRPEDLDWRVGQHSRDKISCTLLCYLTARAVMDRLDQVCGPGGWSDSYAPIMENNKLAGFVCTLAILTPTGWVVKSDVADTTDIEAIKGACSGALKRAAVHWGIGRYLYDIDGKRYYKIKEGYAPDGSNAINVPIGEKPNTKPGHVFPPELPAWAKPATGTVVGNGPLVWPEDGPEWGEWGDGDDPHLDAFDPQFW